MQWIENPSIAHADGKEFNVDLFQANAKISERIAAWGSHIGRSEAAFHKAAQAKVLQVLEIKGEENKGDANEGDLLDQEKATRYGNPDELHWVPYHAERPAE